MSVSAELWRIAAATQAADAGPIPAPQPGIAMNSNLRNPLASLVRQVFFPAATLKRRHILFLAADEETRALELCESAALALAELTANGVAVVGGALLPPEAKKPPHSIAEASFWRTHAFPLSERVWRLPAWLFCDRIGQQNSDHRRPPSEFLNVFDYFLFAARPGSGELPVFCGVCDAAVLVVTANRTRRDSAISARDQLARYKVPLLGAVLNDRVFEIPEAIYRRL